MLTSFQDTPQFSIYLQAIDLKGFSAIKDTFLAGLDAMTELSDNQKIAIRLAAEKLPYYPDSSPMVPDGELLGILRVAWEDVGLTSGVTALTDTQRETIFAGVMAVCQNIIEAEADRLAALTLLDVSLPADWNTPDPEEEPIQA